jgi:gamma-glutamyl-gamma-aminobutyrate hydrolase PuuD
MIYDDTNYPHVAAGKWSVSRDGETYHGIFETFSEARAEQVPFIGICRRPPVLQVIDATDLIDKITEQEEWSLDAASGSLEPTRKQKEELTLMLRAVFSIWSTKHDLWPKWSLVAEVGE